MDNKPKPQLNSLSIALILTPLDAKRAEQSGLDYPELRLTIRYQNKFLNLGYTRYVKKQTRQINHLLQQLNKYTPSRQHTFPQNLWITTNE